MRDKTDGMSLTARYNVSALAFGKDLRVQMKERYKTELAAAMARRNEPLEADEFDQDAANAHHMQVRFYFDGAVVYLASALKEHLVDAFTMLLCV